MDSPTGHQSSLAGRFTPRLVLIALVRCATVGRPMAVGRASQAFDHCWLGAVGCATHYARWAELVCRLAAGIQMKLLSIFILV
jgi:hypothetical protein